MINDWPHAHVLRLVFSSSTIDSRFVDYFCASITYSRPQEESKSLNKKCSSDTLYSSHALWGPTPHIVIMILLNSKEYNCCKTCTSPWKHLFGIPFAQKEAWFLLTFPVTNLHTMQALQSISCWLFMLHHRLLDEQQCMVRHLWNTACLRTCRHGKQYVNMTFSRDHIGTGPMHWLCNHVLMAYKSFFLQSMMIHWKLNYSRQVI